MKKIKQGEKDFLFYQQQLERDLSFMDMTTLDEVRQKAQDKMTAKCKERQKKKFDQLMARSEEKHTSGSIVNPDKWVKNYSSKQLTMNEKKVLAKGLNFSLTPAKIPIPEIIVSVENGLRKVKSGKSQAARINVIGALKKAKLPVSNISSSESRAIKDLNKDSSIVILPADKGRLTVVLDKTDYDSKVKSMLSDSKTYKKLSRDPASALERKMNSFLLSLKRSGVLPSSLYYQLRSSSGKTPQFYGLPKIHKPGVPLRPIVSFVNSPTYRLSKHLVTLLSPLVGKTSSNVANSFEFSGFIANQSLPDGVTLVSFDVVSLFTKIPVDVAADVAYERLQEDPTLGDRTMLSPDQIKQLLLLCLNAAYLAYDNEFYQQTFGTAMGSPVSVVVADLVMEDVEERALRTYHSPPLFWKRYVDDICAALERNNIDDFKQHIDSIEPSIKFTMELESNKQLSFLDTTIHHHEDGSLSTTVYRKPTQTDKYLSFDSHHPMEHKRAVATTLFHRAKKICSFHLDRVKEEEHVTQALRQNGYPLKMIERISKKMSTNSARNSIMEDRQPVATVVLPYIRNVSESIRRILTPLNIRTCFRPHKTLRQLLVHPKTPIQINQRNGVVYKITCGTCKEVYIGQTGRTLQHRVKEHQRALTSFDAIYNTSAVAEHAIRRNHQIDWSNVKVIDCQQNWTQRCLLESWYIKKTSNTINRENGPLPEVYNALIT